MTHLLFICSQCKLRSPTAEAVFSQYEGIEAISAGTNNDAETPLTADLIDWSDIVFVMEKAHRNRVTQKFRSWLRNKPLVVLGIPDNYAFMDAELVHLLETRVARHLRQALVRKTDG
ncbi:MAG: low molecular weight protein tyrosine phosphatase family protein [Kiloniellaceae bacterium]